MADYIDAALALLTIAFGLFGLIAPRYTASALDLETGQTTMGLSEMRASVGGLFVAVGAVCLLSGAPAAYAMLGVVYLGAGIGRLVSLIVDAPPRSKALVFFAFEAGPCIWLLARHGASLW